MDQIISKVRTKKIKTKEKRASKSLSRKYSIHDNPAIGILIATLSVIFVLFIIKADCIIGDHFNKTLLLSLVGDGAYLFIGMFITAILFNVIKPGFLNKNSNIILLCLISFISIIPAKIFIYLSTSTELIHPETAQFLLPFAMAPLLATILICNSAGTLLGLWTSFILTIMTDKSFPIFVTGILASVVTVQIAQKVTTRSKIFRITLVIGLSEIICVLAMTLLAWDSSNIHISPILHQAGACFAGSFFSAIAVLLVLPIFETLFRITTDITLLEMSDLGHSLLQKLAIEAPGTYHHSLVVASLAQSAADEIGANSLQARVCAYFHDIGKLTKPDFFAENIQLQNNPHDDLQPSMSTLVITSHVKDGLSLAILNKLPDPIKKVIHEHHGTSLLSFFHHKAKTQLEFKMDKQNSTQSNGYNKIDEGIFRYNGPIPSSRESAIICLADAVEAASRSIKKTTADHIENMVNDIVMSKLNDGQLDQSGLTLNELKRIKRSLTFTLNNILHGRIPYPKNENRNKQRTKAETR